MIKRYATSGQMNMDASWPLGTSEPFSSRSRDRLPGISAAVISASVAWPTRLGRNPAIRWSDLPGELHWCTEYVGQTKINGQEWNDYYISANNSSGSSSLCIDARVSIKLARCCGWCPRLS